MRAIDLQPTQENVKEMFFKDAIGRNSDVIRFCTILDSIEGSFSIALDGKWGSGKTFFVKQVKLILDAYNVHICNPVAKAEVQQIKDLVSRYKVAEKGFAPDPQIAVYYDAWANDNDEDPILSLIYAIIQSADTDYKIDNNHDFLSIGSNIASLFSGKSVSALLKAIKGDDPLAIIKSEKSLNELIAEFFDALLYEHGNRLVVLIDELDRCKPSYAVKLLERVKHYFWDDRITFVFSINTEQLQHTIKRYYGEEFNASRYLDRFFTLRTALSQANLNKFYESIAFTDTAYVFDKTCLLVIDVFHFELREIAKFLNLARIAAHVPTHDNRNYDFSLQYILIYFVPIMIALKIYDESAYTEFVTGKNVTPLYDVYERAPSGFFRLDDFLDPNETYDDQHTENGSILITEKEKLKEIYEALFAQVNDQGSYQKVFGRMRLSVNMKNTILRTASLLSDFADYSL